MATQHITHTGKAKLHLVSTASGKVHNTHQPLKHHWRKSMVLPEVNIRKALKILDDVSLRVLLVVDCDGALLGIVCDGDIRRGLIAGVSLEAPIAEVMNSQPITAGLDTPKSELIDTMSKRDLLAIPLLEKGKLAGLQTLTHVLLKPHFDNPVFLMAGGGGTRLRPLTNDCPKPLLHVGNRPLLERTLNNFIGAGFNNFYISTHYIPEMIKDYFGNGEKWGVNIRYVHEKSPLGTAGALGLLPHDLPELPIIMMNGDVLTNIDFAQLLEFHLGKNADATLCVREIEYQIPYGVIQADNGRITNMEEKPKYQHHINAGIYVLNHGVAKSVARNQHIDMPTLLENHISSGAQVDIFPIQEYWLDIGSMADFSRAQIDIESLNL